MTSRTQLPVWQQLKDHAEQMQACHMKKLFDQDPARFERFSIQLPQLLLDYSKNLINEDTMGLLMQLARDVDVEQWRDKMFAGERINFTEDRAVLHVALRDLSKNPLMVDGEDVRQQVKAALAQMETFVDKVLLFVSNSYHDMLSAKLSNIYYTNPLRYLYRIHCQPSSYV